MYNSLNPANGLSFDVVLADLENRLETIRLRTYELYTLPTIYMKAAPCQPKLIFGHEQRVGYQRYRIKAFIDTAWAEIGISMDGQDPRKPFDCHQPELETFVTNLAQRVRASSDETPYNQAQETRQQSLWWEANEKKFNIFRLPAELRAGIWNAHLPDVVYPLKTWTLHSQPELLPILALGDKKISQEVINHFYTHTTFGFGSCDMLTDFIWPTTKRGRHIHKGPNPELHKMKRLELSMGYRSFLEVLGLPENCRSRDNAPTFKHLIRAIHVMKPSRLTGILRSLQLLELTIRIRYSPPPPSGSFESESDWWSDGCRQKLDQLWFAVVANAFGGLSRLHLVVENPSGLCTDFEEEFAEAAREYVRFKKEAPARQTLDHFHRAQLQSAQKVMAKQKSYTPPRPITSCCAPEEFAVLKRVMQCEHAEPLCD